MENTDNKPKTEHIIIPNVPKEDRESFNEGAHDIPDWQFYVILVGFVIVCFLLYIGLIGWFNWLLF